MIQETSKNTFVYKSMLGVLVCCLVLCFSSVAVKSMATPAYLIYTITTPSGNAVNYTYLVAGENVQAVIDAGNSYVDNTYPLVNRIRSATGKYNCHSYAWYSTSSSNNIWITSSLSYTSDQYYTLIAYGTQAVIPTNAPVGSKVVYPSDGHSAKKYSSTKLISKWGDWGLCIHTPGYCPYTYSTLLGYYN